MELCDICSFSVSISHHPPPPLRPSFHSTVYSSDGRVGLLRAICKGTIKPVEFCGCIGDTDATFLMCLFYIKIVPFFLFNYSDFLHLIFFCALWLNIVAFLFPTIARFIKDHDLIVSRYWLFI